MSKLTNLEREDLIRRDGVMEAGPVLFPGTRLAVFHDEAGSCITVGVAKWDGRRKRAVQDHSWEHKLGVSVWNWHDGRKPDNEIKSSTAVGWSPLFGALALVAADAIKAELDDGASRKIAIRYGMAAANKVAQTLMATGALEARV